MTRSTRSDAAAKGGENGPPRERFPRAARLRGAGEIRRVLREGRRVRAPVLDVFVATNELDRPRLAVIVPLYGNPVVLRNRIRRRLREAARTGWLPEAFRDGLGLDVVVRAKPGAFGTSYERLRASLLEALEAACGD